MTSPLGTASSRANGARSRDPVTPEGKARASQNAVRDGLLADSMVLEGESEDRFCAMLSCLRNGLQTGPGIETDQVEIMAVAHWRCMRLWSLGKAQYVEETRKRRATAREDGDTAITRLARSFRSLADESRAMELLNRYEIRFNREYLRALTYLKKHRFDRKKIERR